MDPVSIVSMQLATQLLESGRWEHLKELLRRGERADATAEIDQALANLKTDEVANLDERTKKDARFKVLALASIDERPLISEVLQMHSAEKVGQNLTRATWALVAASAALVVATIVLVIITSIKS
jgi:hypothetical protein